MNQSFPLWVKVPLTRGDISRLNITNPQASLQRGDLLKLNLGILKNPRPAPSAGVSPGSLSAGGAPAPLSGARLQGNTPQTRPISPAPRPAAPAPAPISKRSLPGLLHPIRKGQKISLSSGPLRNIRAKVGWNVKRPEVDINVSAFLLDEKGMVPGDEWFVFYGQTASPDGKAVFRECSGNAEREEFLISLEGLNPRVKKIVFVLTIYEAFAKKLNFSMVEDAYIRILNNENGEELASFAMTDYYPNVISMMIGEVYQHNNIWKFTAVGNGVAKDLQGLCELYGVQTE